MSASPSLEIVAYKERPSHAPSTGEVGVLRDEWRVRTFDEFEANALRSAFGSYWIAQEYILEHRYIRRGKEEPWTPSGSSGTFEGCLELIDETATSVSSALDVIRERYALDRAKAADQEALRERAKLAETDEAIRQERADAAFVRMRDGTSAGAALAARWQSYVQRRSDDADFKARCLADDRFMRAYNKALDSITVPTKRAAIRDFLARYDQ